MLTLPTDYHPRVRILRQWLQYVLRFFVFLTFTAFTVMMLVAVFNRFVLNDSLVEAEEFNRYSLVWMTLLAAPLVTAESGHLSGSFMGFIKCSWAPHLETIAIKGGIFIFGVCLAITTWDMVRMTIARSPAMGVPMAFIYASMLVGAIFDIIIVVLDVVIGAQPKPKIEYME